MIEDITERKRAEGVLRDRDALLHKLTQQVPGVIHQLKRTPEGRLTMPYVSLGLRDAYELDTDDVHNDARAMFARIHPEDAKPMWASTLRSFETLEPWRATYRVLLPKAGLRWHEAHSVPERLPDGSVLWTGYIVDITDRKHYEEVSVAAEAAQRANIAKTEFLSRMSHELRTPLNAVLGFSQLLLAEGAEPLSDAQRAKLKHIETAGGHLLAMINDVLDLSRVESGSMLLSHDVVQVDAVVGEALAMVASLAQRTGVWLRADPPARAPGAAALYVRADHVRLCQVLVNLLSNALKYNHSGGSAVIDWCAGPDGRSVLIGVTDTGPGLSEQQRAHLFEPFNRLGAERSKVEGTGIGLVITRRLVELMQGELSVHSEFGRGSRFELRLPAAEPRASADRRVARARGTGAQRSVRRRQPAQRRAGARGVAVAPAVPAAGCAQRRRGDRCCNAPSARPAADRHALGRHERHRRRAAARPERRTARPPARRAVGRCGARAPAPGARRRLCRLFDEAGQRRRAARLPGRASRE